MVNYTSYWKPKTAKNPHNSINPINHSASEQYKRVLVNDVLWILTVEDRKLFLLGAGQVEKVMNDAEAVEKFGDGIWEAGFHVAFTEPYVPLQWRDITAIAPEIRFEGPKATLPQDSSKWANSLQAMRKLTGNSVDLLANQLSDLAIGGFLEISSQKLETPEEIEARKEGKEILRSHLRRERLAYIRDQKLRESLKPYQCEACEMTFKQKYGDIGNNFIEVHHKRPIANGERATSLKDLALLCSNCHRMIHKTDLLSDIEEFKKRHLVNNQV
jgi:hypothetical protein